MHILLTDITSCPRCGPGFGLILLVEEITDRRVQHGWLGCPNCRERYRIADGVADLRGGGEPLEPSAAAAPGTHDAARLAALAGVTHGPAYLLVAGPASAHAAALAELLPEVHVIAAAGEAGSAHTDVTRLLVARALPFYSGRLAGVVLSGAAAAALLEEGARVLAPGGRLVLEPVPGDAADRIERAGLRMMAVAPDVAVAARA